MARFLNAKYEGDDGEIYPMRVRATTLTAANPAATASATKENFVRAGGSSRAFGIRARQVVISREIGDPAVEYGSATISVSLPVPTLAAFSALEVGSAFTYKGINNWYISDLVNESIK